MYVCCQLNNVEYITQKKTIGYKGDFLIHFNLNMIFFILEIIKRSDQSLLLHTDRFTRMHTRTI